MKYFVFLFFTLVGFSSCLKTDSPITLPPKGNGEVMQVDMGDKYNYQIFVSLAQGKIIHISEANMYHLAFQTGANQFGIFINESNSMQVARTSKTAFSEVNSLDTSGNSSQWRVDLSVGNIDSSAFGNWQKNKEVFIVKPSKETTQFIKFQIMDANAVEYKVKMGDLNDPIGTVISIPKSANQNYTYFSFKTMSVVNNVEPSNNENWDLHFCVYNHTFYEYNPPLPYSVVGVILNAKGTLAYKDSTQDYNAIDANFENQIQYSNKLDVIGYDWKYFDRDKTLYTIVSKYKYLIRNQNGLNFKLRFIDFYSPTGNKGSPRFEFQSIN